MCGITGFINSKKLDSSEAGTTVFKMSNSLTHRGPDDSGIWVDENYGLAFGHRRLSILDLSSAGHQPMHSAYGTYVLIFNGEIYNHLELRRQLEKQTGAIFMAEHRRTGWLNLPGVCRPV